MKVRGIVVKDFSTVVSKVVAFFFNVQNLTRVLFCSRLPTTTYLCICGALLFAMPTVIAVYAA